MTIVATEIIKLMDTLSEQEQQIVYRLLETIVKNICKLSPPDRERLIQFDKKLFESSAAGLSKDDVEKLAKETD